MIPLCQGIAPTSASGSRPPLRALRIRTHGDLDHGVGQVVLADVQDSQRQVFEHLLNEDGDDAFRDHADVCDSHGRAAVACREVFVRLCSRPELWNEASASGLPSRVDWRSSGGIWPDQSVRDPSPVQRVFCA